MADLDQKKSTKSAEDDVWAAISAFEQILGAIPNDRASLEALAHAFQQIGDHTQARDYLLRLGEVFISEGDYTAAREILDKLRTYTQEDSRVAELIGRIEGLPQESATTAAKAGGPEKPEAPAVEQRKVARGFSMAEELSCAWNLLQAGELTEDQYSSMVQDLGEMSLSEGKATVSVLHVLEARGAKNLEKVINYYTRECDTPFLTLTNFDLHPDVVGLLPMEFMLKRGAIVFELIGKDGLAVVMNPFNMELRKDVETLAGRRCHFYITLPSEFDAAISRIREVVPET